MSTSIVKEYLDLTSKYKKEYGEKTLVLLQVGAFFEIYGLKTDDGNIFGSNIEEIWLSFYHRVINTDSRLFNN